MIRHGNSIFNIGSSIPCIPDLDASKVIETVRSTGVTITPAMMHYAHYLISNMKNIGTWQLSNAVYGFVGGTSASHKFNWKDLRDVDAAFRLTYTGGVTHSANGIQFDGSTGYSNSFLIPSTTLSSASTNLYTYVKASSITTANTTPYVMGVVAVPSVGNNFGITNRHNGTSNTKIFVSTNASIIDAANQSGAVAVPFLKSYSGNYLSGVMGLWSNGVKLTTTNIDAGQSALPSSSVYIGANNSPVGVQNFDNKLLSCVMIGAGLTDAQIIQRDQIINNAQLILNRA